MTNDDSMLEDRKQLARDLHAIATRIDDGEYEVTNIELSKPAPDGRDGEFAIGFCTEEEWARMRAAFEAQSPGGSDE